MPIMPSVFAERFMYVVLTCRKLCRPRPTSPSRRMRVSFIATPDDPKRGCSYPVLFYKPVTSLIGTEVPVTVPKHAQPVEKHLPDYEVELTVVIGKPAKNVSEAEALDYVLAYTGGNDVSIHPPACNTPSYGVL